MQTAWWSITKTGRYVKGNSLVRGKGMINRKCEKYEKQNISIWGPMDKNQNKNEPQRPQYCCHSKYNNWSP
jgi:predicted patatin/cPLA2 family phospholipase